MKFAYADPPYLGCGQRYADLHEEAMRWDDPDEHAQLIDRLCDEYPDGWAVSLHEPSLRLYASVIPANARIAAWVKPFASFKPNVTRAYTWEPVVFYGGRHIHKSQPTWRDHFSEPITLRKGLTGAKPLRFCHWVLDGLNYQPGDMLDDLFPGTGIMSVAVAERNASAAQMDFGLWEAAQ